MSPSFKIPPSYPEGQLAFRDDCAHVLAAICDENHLVEKVEVALMELLELIENCREDEGECETQLCYQLIQINPLWKNIQELEVLSNHDIEDYKKEFRDSLVKILGIALQRKLHENFLTLPREILDQL